MTSHPLIDEARALYQRKDVEHWDELQRMTSHARSP